MNRTGKYEYKKLGDVATFINGYPFKPSDWVEKGIPIIRIQNLNNDNAAYNYYKGAIDSRYFVNYGDVLISWSGTLGVYEWDKKTSALLNQHIFKVIFDKIAIDKSYFKYSVSSRINEMKGKVHGITMQHITKGEFDKTSIPVPPIPEQEHIVAELDLLQGIIDKQKAQLKEYDTLAQSIFYDMFGDPVENEKGWEITRLGDLCSTITKGTTPTTLGYSFVSEGVNFVKVESFKDGIIDSSKLAHITKECHDVLCRSQLDDCDLLVCIAGATIGKTAVVDKSILPANTNQACAIIRLSNKSEITYIRTYLKHKLRLDVEQMRKGVAQPNLSLGQMRNLTIVHPPLQLQQQFAEKIEAIEKHKTAINKSLEETQKLFDYTMDKYFG